MISRRLVILLTAVLAIGATMAVAGAGEIAYWTCGMHPSVKSDEPGKCPICNMDLVPVEQEVDVSAAEGEQIERIIGEEAARLARIRAVPVERMELSLPIDAPGELAYDESRSSAIASRVGGWIERLHADETGMKLRKGDPLVDIYSPELVSAQKEYLLARGTELEPISRRKLLLLGLTENQVGGLREASDISTVVTILSPAGGTVVHRGVTEGERIEAGHDLFHISDLSRLWVLADIFENDIGFVSAGQDASIEIESMPGVDIPAKVDFIEPATDRRTRSTRIRLEVENGEGLLRPGMFARVRIDVPLGGTEESGGSHGMHMESGGVLAVPRGAIVNTGRRAIAFVENGPGRYLLREVKLGVLAGDHYVVLEGLSEGERVVEKGSFLLDSQARLTGQAEEIYGGALGKESEKTESPPAHIH